MKVIPATRARRRWSHFLSRVQHAGERIIICRSGRAVAALVPHGDVELLVQLANEADIEEARRAIAREMGAPPTKWDEVKQYAEIEE